MNRLPQELYDTIGACFSDRYEDGRIVPYLDPPFKRPALATVSRRWQTAIERQTFRHISLKSTDLDAFEKIVRGDRRRFLRSIQYTIVLPTYGKLSCGRFEREPDRLANDNAFTIALHGLFRILRSWDDGKDFIKSNCSFRLDILDVYSPMDDGYRLHGNTNRAERLDAVIPGNGDQISNRDLRDRRFQYSYLRLLRPTDLPLVPAVKSFHTNRMKRSLSHETAIEIAARLPNLTSGDWYMLDSERLYPTLRRTIRARLTQAVQNLLPTAGLQAIRLYMDQNMLWNHSWQPADLRPTGTTFDPLCRTIREATAECEALTSLYIRGTLDARLPWPTPDPTTIVRPFWQNLEHLNVHFHMTTPSGTWYFRAQSRSQNPVQSIPAPSNTQVPPGYGSSEEDDIVAALQYSDLENTMLSGYPPSVFRLVPNEELLAPLIGAFAQACLQIPSLKVASLSTTIAVPLEFEGRRTYTPSEWGIWFAAPGASFHWQLQLEPAFRDDMGQRRLVFDTKHWQPDEHLCNLLRGIGRERYGEELVEKHVDYWDSITKPKVLEYYRGG